MDRYIGSSTRIVWSSFGFTEKETEYKKIRSKHNLSAWRCNDSEELRENALGLALCENDTVIFFREHFEWRKRQNESQRKAFDAG